MKLQFYGILRRDDGELPSINLSSGGPQDQFDVYLANAFNLYRSLRFSGYDFTLLTNDTKSIAAASKRMGISIPVEEIQCATKVPTGTRFYSAHFKLDAFKYFACKADQYLVLCDLDMICTRKAPINFKNIVDGKIPIYYDISNQVIPVYGAEVIAKDLCRLTNAPSEARWSGGELIGGPPSFFAELSKIVDELWPRYLGSIDNLHHVGDEAFVSAALETMRRNGIYTAEAGSLGIVARYWNCSTQHPQHRFAQIKDSFLLHLPRDKRFLARIGLSNDFKYSLFIIYYYMQILYSFPLRFLKSGFRIFSTQHSLIK